MSVTVFSCENNEKTFNLMNLRKRVVKLSVIRFLVLGQRLEIGINKVIK